ncbi:MAG: LolA family protein, partial [Pseudomonadota bacterium]
MYRRIICMLVFLCIIFFGCTGERGGSYEDVSRKLTELEDYTCDVTMRVTNNRSTQEYKLKHFYKSPDRYRIEVLAPKELRGQ